MYTLVLEYRIRKFITTKILANNEYEEDQLAKGDGYLNKLLQVVPAYVENGHIIGSSFTEDGTQIDVQARLTVPGASEAEALFYLDRYRSEIPDQGTLKVIKVIKQ